MKADPQILVARRNYASNQRQIFGKPWEFGCKAHSHSHFLPLEKDEEELANHTTQIYSGPGSLAR